VAVTESKKNFKNTEDTTWKSLQTQERFNFPSHKTGN